MSRTPFLHLSLAASVFVLIACSGGEVPPEQESDAADLTAAPAVSANPEAPALPASWIATATNRSVIAVAGTNSGKEATAAVLAGEGTRERPFHQWQALEAAATILEVTGSTSDVIYA